MLEDTPTILAHADLIKNGFQDSGIQQEKMVSTGFVRHDWCGGWTRCNYQSMRGLYKQRTTELYPCEQALRYMKQKGVRMMLSADTHLLTELTSGFEYAVGVLQNNGINEITVFRKEGSLWKFLFLLPGLIIDGIKTQKAVSPDCLLANLKNQILWKIHKQKYYDFVVSGNTSLLFVYKLTDFYRDFTKLLQFDVM